MVVPYRRGRHVRRHGPHHRGADERTARPADRGREHHRRRRHHRRQPRRQRRARRLYDPARLDRHPRLQPDDLQEAPLRRRQRLHAGHAVLRAADGAGSAQGPARQHHSGVRRAAEGERREDAIRLGRRRLDHASGLFAAQLDDRRQRHPRALSRLGAGGERPDRRADRLPVRQPRRCGAADHRQAGEGDRGAVEEPLAADAGPRQRPRAGPDRHGRHHLDRDLPAQGRAAARSSTSSTRSRRRRWRRR